MLILMRLAISTHYRGRFDLASIVTLPYLTWIIPIADERAGVQVKL